MSDEIKKKHFLSDDSVFPDEPDAVLTTADLAGAGEFVPRTAKVDVLAEDESVLEVESEPIELPRVEVPAVVSRTGTYAVAAAPAKERETGPLFRAAKRKTFAPAGMRYKSVLWMNHAGPSSKQTIWSPEP